MSLQGTLRTLGITEVLEFLADRSATGRLDINAESGSATYWMLRGEVADVDYEFERESGVDAAESTYYALSELDGTFFFDEGEAPEHGTPTESVVDVLGRTADIAEGWSIVEEWIPSPHHQLIRSDVLDASVTIEPEWWRAIEAISAGCSARSLAHALDMRALAASTMAADMARAGLITVGEPAPVVEELAVDEPIVEAPPEIDAVVPEAPLVAEEPPHMQVAPPEAADVFAEQPVAEPPSVGFSSEPTPTPAVDPFAAATPDAASMDATADPAAPAWPSAPEPASADDGWSTEPAPAPVAEAAPSTPTWDTPAAAAPVPEAAPAWPTEPAPAPAAETAPSAPTWDTPATAAPVPEAAPAWPTEPAPTAAAPTPEPSDDGWATDHSQVAAANQFPEQDPAASTLASWGAAAESAPAPAPAAPAPAPAANNPFADLPSESDLAAAPPAAPSPVPPAPVAEPVAPTDGAFQAAPTQAAIFATAPPAPTPSPYAPDAAPVAPAPIAPPAGSVDQLAALDDLDDEDDEDFGTDDRSSVLKFLRRD